MMCEWCGYTYGSYHFVDGSPYEFTCDICGETTRMETLSTDGTLTIEKRGGDCVICGDRNRNVLAERSGSFVDSVTGVCYDATIIDNQCKTCGKRYRARSVGNTWDTEITDWI